MPSKLDYLAILSDVNKEIYNLAYGFLGRTYLGMDIIITQDQILLGDNKATFRKEDFIRKPRLVMQEILSQCEAFRGSQ